MVNTQDVTNNSADSIFTEEIANGHDPIVEYSLLSDSVADGIFAWISFGVDLTSQQSLTGAATLTSSGGVANANSGMGGGGGPGGNGTFSGGSPPSGVPGGVTNGTIIANGTTLANGTASSSGIVSLTTVVSASSEVVASTGFVLLLVLLGVF